MRTLVHLEKVNDLQPIEGADMIEIATVLGWMVVVKKGLYQVGDPIIYFEVDSKLPEWDMFAELEKAKYRINTIKLRGQISQGYCVPFQNLDKIPKDTQVVDGMSDTGKVLVVDGETIPLDFGTDLTDVFSVEKYEPPVTMKGGETKGNFPGFIPKTEQERIQNLTDWITKYPDIEWEVTEKLDGTSVTVYHKEGDVGVCSRNLELKMEGDEIDAKVTMMKKNGIIDNLKSYGKDIALQGEMIGPDVQSNIYGLNKLEYRVFDVYLIREGRYATHEERGQILEDLDISDMAVPFLEYRKIGGFNTVNDIVLDADGASVLNPKVMREGLVYKSNVVVHNDTLSFKAISKNYLTAG